jgi:hypothetical protein
MKENTLMCLISIKGRHALRELFLIWLWSWKLHHNLLLCDNMTPKVTEVICNMNASREEVFF